MIDNVILLITGTLHDRDLQEMLHRCHPLGMFDSIGALTVATNVQELYSTVLIDSPIGININSQIFCKMLVCSRS